MWQISPPLLVLQERLHLMRLRSSVGAVCTIAALLTLTACSSVDTVAEGYAKDADTLVLGLVPDQQGAGDQWQPLITFLEEKTGKDVELAESVDYAALIEASVAGHVDVGVISAFTYVAATNAGAQLDPISAIVETEGGEPGYDSVAIVPSSSNITSLAAFAGKRVCFVDYGSTSGYLYPSAALLDVGIDPEKDITPIMAGDHNLAAQKTAQGVECDAGFAQESVVENTGVAEGLFREGDLRIVNRTEIPGKPIVVSTSLPDDVQNTIREALVGISVDDIRSAGIDTPDGFLAQFWSSVAIDDSYYDGVRDVCELTQAPQCQL
jgi:phosphonate transport system substrate-binding protein